MKKFKCNECFKPCFLQIEDNANAPQWCPYLKKGETTWHEVKDETVTDCSQLPKLTAEVFDRPDCPDWAKYAAVEDDDGYACWYEKNPGLFYTGRGHGSKVKFIGCFDACINTIIERPAKALPDWCKVGEWVYYIPLTEYCKIEQMNEGFMLRFIDGDSTAIPLKDVNNLAQTRMRKFTDKEMQNLVGKVFTTVDGDVSIATDYDNYMKSICICFEWFNNKELADSIWQLDGKPCYVLEHLENGEWVG